ncbi:MAG TPA: L-seryl-tRNA(Sec) selenium transferase [Actinomycetes bacterium]|nr:L-seryl-tRNA(Sec) selenium transferase [Actinomycetes bacterium]
MQTDPRRALPKVDALLGHPAVAGLVAERGRGPVVAAVRRALRAAREAAAGGAPVPAADELAGAVGRDLALRRAGRTRAVVNATGVVLHTNLGRAPLAEAARAALLDAAGYATVELDLASGTRARRGAAAEALLAEAAGAPAALVVNNAAGALLLVLGALARDREVVVSRGELIEIGGEFRLPAVMEAAGALLVEVGTTNRTRPADYARAITGRTALVLAVHPSNYRVVGFTERPPLDTLATVAREHGLPLVFDAGSGLLGGRFGDEPAVAACLAAGAGLVVFSGDKLLGGPQAGCVVGRAALVRRLARHPLARAVRADKLTLAALEATLEEHLAGRRDRLPVWRALLATPEELRARAAALAERLAALGVAPAALALVDGVSVAGGGSLPGEGLPAALLAVDPAAAGGHGGAEGLLGRLRAGDPPVVARVERGRVLVDLRTVPPAQDEVVAAALSAALGS